MAVGLGVPERFTCSDNNEAKQIIEGIGKLESLAGNVFSVNPISGVPGTFYTTNRLRDLKEIAQEIINERPTNP